VLTEEAGDGGEGEAVDVSRLDMRVGHIVNAKKHPDADALYVEEVDLGEGRIRMVVSGLVKHVPLDQVISVFGNVVVITGNGSWNDEIRRSMLYSVL
jgi:tRNA-binding EMAP/Myf-like protein